MKRIADQTSFNAMKANKSVNYSCSKGLKRGMQFIRKGEVSFSISDATLSGTETLYKDYGTQSTIGPNT